MVQLVSNYITAELKMSDVILRNSYLMLLLEHFEIEVPVLDKTVVQLCNDKGLNVELFLTFANLYNGLNYKPEGFFSSRDLEHIVAYLKNSHRYYSEEMYPNISKIIKDMSDVNKYPEMHLVEKFFEEYFSEVTEHLEYENEVVFPYILNLISSNTSIKTTIDYSVSEYKEHHNDIEEKLDDLKNLIVRYLPHQNDRELRRRLLFSLFELDFDLTIHSKIEDKILIPLVSKIESQQIKIK